MTIINMRPKCGAELRTHRPTRRLVPAAVAVDSELSQPHRVGVREFSPTIQVMAYFVGWLFAVVLALFVGNNATLAEVVVFDNSGGPFEWEVFLPGDMCDAFPGSCFLDITQPPTQSGELESNTSLTRQIFSQLGSDEFGVTDWVEFWGGTGVIATRGMQIAASVDINGADEFSFAPPRPLFAGDVVGPDMLWSSSADLWLDSGGLPLPFGPIPTLQPGRHTFGLRFDLEGLTHFGWIEVDMPEQLVLTPRRWAYETSPDTPIQITDLPAPGPLVAVDVRLSPGGRDTAQGIGVTVGDAMELVGADFQVDVDNRRNLVRLTAPGLEFSTALSLSLENMIFSSATELVDVEVIYADLSPLSPSNPPQITTSADAFSITWPESELPDNFIVDGILIRYNLAAIPEPHTTSLLVALLLTISCARKSFGIQRLLGGARPDGSRS